MSSRLTPGERPLHWVGSSKKDLLEFPSRVVRAVGIALGSRNTVASTLRQSLGRGRVPVYWKWSKTSKVEPTAPSIRRDLPEPFMCCTVSRRSRLRNFGRRRQM